MYTKLFFVKIFVISILLNYINCDDNELLKNIQFQRNQNRVLVTNICDEFSLDGKSKWNDDQFNEIMNCFINNEFVYYYYEL